MLLQTDSGRKDTLPRTYFNNFSVVINELWGMNPGGNSTRMTANSA